MVWYFNKVPHCLDVFCVRNILNLTFSLTCVSVYSVIFSVPEILSSVPFNLSVNIGFVIPAQIAKFCISKVPLVSSQIPISSLYFQIA